MPFNRPPRLRTIIKPCTIEIPQPPEVPPKPSINWLSVVLPMLLMIMIFGGLAIFGGSSFGSSYLLFLPLILISGVVSIINYFVQSKSYKKEVADAVQRFSKLLETKKKDLERILEEHDKIAGNNDPDLKKCFELVLNGDGRLGERRLNDNDFLNLRIGLGVIESGINVEFSDGNHDGAFSQLLGTARAYKNKFSKLENAPVTVNLRQLGNIGICGDPTLVHDLASAMLMQIATHHWPSEVNFALFCKLGNYDRWKWLKDTPHKNEIFDPKLTPVVVVDKLLESSKRQLSLLEDELRRRETYLTSQGEKNGAALPGDFPALVIIIDYIENIYDYPSLAILLQKGVSLNVFGVFLCKRHEDIPGECRAVIEVKNKKIKLSLVDPLHEPLDGIEPDKIGDIDLGIFAQKLGNIPWLITSEVTASPAHVPFLDLFGTVNADTLSIEKWWLDRQPWGYLKSPIGKISLGNNFLLDLNQGDFSHGPHGFIGGTTGSGKSELLKTIILSYAITHSPYEINFALIDYKGGATFKGFEELPHVVGVITDIESHKNYARRVILALEGEVQQRKQFLLDAQEHYEIEANFDQYHSLEVKKSLARLIIIFDEFAEFKDQHPEESKSLINLARQGRSLGIHLILCTQNPRAAVNAQVRQNSRFRICLKVATKEDSTEILGVPDAWALPTGKALFLVNNIIDFQGAYTEADYREDESIILVRDNGTREFIYASNSKPIVKKQSKVVIDKIKQASSNLGMSTPPKVWPAPLKEQLCLPEILQDESLTTSWTGKDWLRTPLPTSIIFGRYDDPEHQKQPLLFFEIFLQE